MYTRICACAYLCVRVFVDHHKLNTVFHIGWFGVHPRYSTIDHSVVISVDGQHCGGVNEQVLV